MIVFNTNYGPITVELDFDKACNGSGVSSYNTGFEISWKAPNRP